MNKKLYFVCFTLSLILFLTVNSVSSTDYDSINQELFGKDGFFHQENEDESEKNLLGDAPPLLKPQWFNDQLLDHFDPKNGNRFAQRYFVNFDYYKDNGPIFLALGGESSAKPVLIVNATIAKNYASHFGAALVLLEHRYYGKSFPTPNMSLPNLQYLSTEQALADIETFIGFFRKTYNLPYNKLIIIGGSYSGNLATWFRLKYPTLATGAVAYSAPLEVHFRFDGYYEVVSAAIGPLCNRQLELAVGQIRDWLKDGVEGWKLIGEAFTICKPGLNGSDPLQVFQLMQYAVSIFRSAVESNGTNEFGQSKIDAACSRLIPNNGKASVTPLKRLVDLIHNGKIGCIELTHSFDRFIGWHTKTEWNRENPKGNAPRLWRYQMCRELGYFLTSYSTKQPFGNYATDEVYTYFCQQVYGRNFTLNQMEQWIADTNDRYEGKDIRTTNVLFVTGQYDPWNPLQVMRNLSSTVQAITVANASHCPLLTPDSPNDRPDVKSAKAQVQRTIQQFLSSAG